MVASYTANGRFTKQGTDDNPNTWGEILNEQVFDLFDDAIFGIAEIDITGTSNVTLTTANGSPDQARHATLKLTGVIGNDIDLYLPSVEKQYFIHALHTGGNVTVKINGSSTEVVLEEGAKTILYTDGVDTVEMFEEPDLSPYLQAANNLSDLDDISEARDNLELGTAALVDVADILSVAYPVGSIYCNANDAENPATLLGFGTWIAFGEGKVLIGAGTHTDVNGEERIFEAEDTGGAYEHQLTEEELPEIVFQYYIANTSQGGNQSAIEGAKDSRRLSTNQTAIPPFGEDEPHNNVQPYVTIYMWVRTV